MDLHDAMEDIEEEDGMDMDGIDEDQLRSEIVDSGVMTHEEYSTQREIYSQMFRGRSSARHSSQKVGGGGVASGGGLKAGGDYGATLSSSSSSSRSQTRGATCLIAGDIEEQVESVQYKKQRK
jgi:hypothetical protein